MLPWLEIRFGAEDDVVESSLSRYAGSMIEGGSFRGLDVRCSRAATKELWPDLAAGLSGGYCDCGSSPRR